MQILLNFVLIKVSGDDSSWILFIKSIIRKISQWHKIPYATKYISYAPFPLDFS